MQKISAQGEELALLKESASAWEQSYLQLSQALAPPLTDPKKQEGILKIKHLPPPPSGKIYHMWGKGAGDQTYAAAWQINFPATSEVTSTVFRPPSPLKSPVGFALSIEDRVAPPGMQPQGPIIFLGD